MNELNNALESTQNKADYIEKIISELKDRNLKMMQAERKQK